MTPQPQVDHLKHSISYFLGEIRGKSVGGFSLEGFLFALQDLEQALNVHDCQDPTVGCSCSGSVRFPLPTAKAPSDDSEHGDVMWHEQHDDTEVAPDPDTD